MADMSKRELGRLRRHKRLRKKVSGSPERPRLVIHRSHLHLEAQIIDDTAGKTLAACSTRQENFRESCSKGGNIEAAKRLGEVIAESAKTAGITRVVFDRGGYPYHGRLKAFVESVRSMGLEV